MSWASCRWHRPCRGGSRAPLPALRLALACGQAGQFRADLGWQSPPGARFRAANAYPVLTGVQLGAGAPSAILGGVEDLPSSNVYPLAALVFFASVVSMLERRASAPCWSQPISAGRDGCATSEADAPDRPAKGGRGGPSALGRPACARRPCLSGNARLLAPSGAPWPLAGPIAGGRHSSGRRVADPRPRRAAGVGSLRLTR